MTEAEKNKLRYEYFKLIIRAWATGDATPLIPCFAGGEAAVNSRFGHINVNYKHESTLVQLGPMPEPLSCVDDTGKHIGVSLWYEAGEICMFDVSKYNTLLFRLKLNDEGKIEEFYGTMPGFFSFHKIQEQ